jgi:hypothetical protein
MKYYCALLFLILGNTLIAPAATVRQYLQNAGNIAKDTDTVVRKQSATVGVSYGSDVQFFGRTGPITYPFMSTDAIYNTKNGFFLYASAYKVLGYNPLIDEIDLGAGYLYHYSKDFTGTASYTRFFFNKDAAQVIKSASSNDLDWNNSYNWTILKSGVTLDYLFGRSHDYFVTISNSKNFESNFGIFDDKDYLSFTPAVNIILGTQNFVQRYDLDHEYQMQANNIYIQNINGPRMARDNGMFNMLNYNFKIPIAYNRPHYTLEFSYKYSIPVNVEGILMNHRESFYNATFYYVFY